MKRLFKYLLVLSSISILMFSCASYRPPKHYNFPKSRTYEMSYNQVWSRIIQWFGNHNTPIKNIDKNSGFISTDYALDVDSYSLYCDCGKPGSFEIFKNAFGNFNVVVVNNSNNSVTVNINTFYKSTYLIYNWATKLYEPYIKKCNSKGGLETDLFNYIEQ